MTTRYWLFAAMLSGILASSGAAQEEKPAAPQVESEAQPADVEKPATKPAEAPVKAAPVEKPVEMPVKPVVETPVKPAVAAPKPATAATVKEQPAKEMTDCAKALVPVAQSYKTAYESMQKWIEDVDAQTSAANAKVKTLQDQVQANEAAITRLKVEGGKQSKSKIGDLSRENKQLWRDLSAAQKEQAALCAGFARSAPQMVRQLSADVQEKLKEAQAQMR